MAMGDRQDYEYDDYCPSKANESNEEYKIHVLAETNDIY